jgi:hypothetical protein
VGAVFTGSARPGKPKDAMMLWCNAMRLRWSGALALLMIASSAWPTTKVLQQAALASPHKRYAANVEWDDTGFIGFLRMRIYLPNGDPYFSVDLPEINPSPANLMWIDEEWVACESFIGDRGSGFCYVHVPSRRGYLIEIIAPRPDVDWVVNYSTNDVVSSAAIRSLCKDRDSLFPILLRDLPTEGPDYFTSEFCNTLREAVDAYSAFRAKEKIKTLELLSDADIRTTVGAIAIASADNVPSVIYFPTGTTTPREMLERSRRERLPETAQRLLNGVDPPIPKAKWMDDRGSFIVEATDADNATSVSVLMRGKFEDAHDELYTGGAERVSAISITESGTQMPSARKPIPAAKGKPPRRTGTSSKRPSRAH